MLNVIAAQPGTGRWGNWTKASVGRAAGRPAISTAPPPKSPAPCPSCRPTTSSTAAAHTDCHRLPRYPASRVAAYHNWVQSLASGDR